MNNFTVEQLQVIRHRGRPLIVFAGPGTGKTRTLVQRTIEILQDGADTEVAFITFTRSSCRDTNRKITQVLGTTGETNRTARASTLHGFAKHLAHLFVDNLGLTQNFSVLAPRQESHLIAEEVIQELSLRVSPTKLRGLLSERRSTNTVRSSHPLSQEQMDRATVKYEALLRVYDASDMEGLVLGAERYLRTGGTVAERLFLHVDEYQDLNPLDQRFVMAILDMEGAEIVVVGDDAQSIYGWRYAHPEGIRTLMTDSSWEHIQFNQCFRLPPHVLTAAEALLGQHGGALQQRGLTPARPSQERIPTFHCTKEKVEAKCVAKQIAELLRVGRQAGSNEPLMKRDIMVLCPSGPLVEAFSHVLESQGIPTRTKKTQEIPEAVWQVLLLLRLVKADNSLAMRQWLELTGIPLEEIRRVRRLAEERRVRLFDYVRQEGPAAWQPFLGALDALRPHRSDVRALAQQLRDATALRVPPHLIEQLERLLPTEVTETLSVGELVTRIYERYGVIETDEEAPDEDRVLVTTLHSSKGLEAQAVFVVQMTDRYMPSPTRDRDEEVRVLYVAMTRAQQLLFFTFSDLFVPGRGWRGIGAMSPLLRGIQQHLLITSVRASDLR